MTCSKTAFTALRASSESPREPRRIEIAGAHLCELNSTWPSPLLIVRSQLGEPLGQKASSVSPRKGGVSALADRAALRRWAVRPSASSARLFKAIERYGFVRLHRGREISPEVAARDISHPRARQRVSASDGTSCFAEQRSQAGVRNRAHNVILLV